MAGRTTLGLSTACIPFAYNLARSSACALEEYAVAKQKVPISERALTQRINRKLLDNDQVLKSARGSRAEQELGGFYVIDFRHNCIVAKDVALRALGRKLGALRSYEYLVED
jgi:hypothetical protein